MWRKYGFYLCKQFLAKCLLVPPPSLLLYKSRSLLTHKQGCCHISLLDSVKKRFKRITRWLNGLILRVRQGKAGSLVAGAGGEPRALPLQLASLGLCFCSESEAEQEIIVLRDTEKYIMEY